MQFNSVLSLKPHPPSDYQTNGQVLESWLDGDPFSIIGSGLTISVADIHEIKKNYDGIQFYFHRLCNSFTIAV